MKLNEITKTGFYTTDLESRETIYEVIENTDKEWLKEDPEATLLIDEWTLDHVDEDNRKCYEIYSGNLVTVKYAEDVEVYEITDTKYKITEVASGTAMREDKPSKLEIAEETIKQSKELCIELENQKKEQHLQWQQRCTENHNEDSRRIDRLQQKLEKIKDALYLFCSGCDYFDGRNFGFDLKDNSVCQQICPKLFKRIQKRILQIIGEDK